jgi:RNA polymerase sigma-70 factor, ECF subfamily
MLHDDDQALLKRCRDGDRDAVETLIRRYEKQVYNLAYRLCGNYDDANDIAQEAFIRVLKAIPEFRGDANFTTWLWRIVTNVYLDDRKRARVRVHTSLEEQMETEDSTLSRQFEDLSPGPHAHAEESERAVIIQKAINDLPEYQRVMIALYHLHGRSYEEIAAIMELPIGTVKSRLNRARRTLQERLRPLREYLGA